MSARRRLKTCPGICLLSRHLPTPLPGNRELAGNLCFFDRQDTGGGFEDPGRLRHCIQLFPRSPDAADVERAPFPAAGPVDRAHDPIFAECRKARDFRDAFGNVCTRLVAPPGLIEIRNEFLIADTGLPDGINEQAELWPVGDLPDEALIVSAG